MAEYFQPIIKSPRNGQKIEKSKKKRTDKAEWGPRWIVSLS